MSNPSFKAVVADNNVAVNSSFDDLKSRVKIALEDFQGSPIKKEHKLNSFMASLLGFNDPNAMFSSLKQSNGGSSVVVHEKALKPLKHYKVTVSFLAENTAYGLEIYHVLADTETHAEWVALQKSTDSQYFDERIEFTRQCGFDVLSEGISDKTVIVTLAELQAMDLNALWKMEEGVGNDVSILIADTDREYLEDVWRGIEFITPENAVDYEKDGFTAMSERSDFTLYLDIRINNRESELSD
ncbi:MAG: hypothetical protein QM500_19600 [Methylococcales bacterium]